MPMIFIDYRDGRPIYEQIRDGFQKLILNGILKADDPMPSVRALAIELSVNPNTIQRAYRVMEDEGLLYSVKGRGSFVADPGGLKEKKTKELRLELDSLLARADSLGIPRADVLRGIADGADGGRTEQNGENRETKEGEQ